MCLPKSCFQQSHRPKMQSHVQEMPANPPAAQETGRSGTGNVPFLLSSPGHPLTRPGPIHMSAPAPIAWHTKALAQHSRKLCQYRSNDTPHPPFVSLCTDQPTAPKRKRPSRANETAREGPALYVRCEPRRLKPPGSARFSYAWASRNLQTLLPHSRPSVMAMPSEQPGMGVTYSMPKRRPQSLPET